MLAVKNPAYVWGAQDPDVLTWDTHKKRWAKGLDCSGCIFYAARAAGIMGVQRTTAYNMAMGLNGWKSKEITSMDAQELDLLFWSWIDKKPFHPFGHVGVAIMGKTSGLLEAAHASESKGIGIYPLRGVMIKDLSRVRRLTIGDKE